jgi:proline dehydrogenase
VSVNRPRIELLVTPHCPHADPAEAAIRAVLAEEEIDADLVRIAVDDLDQAGELDFHGSPTVRIDGVDLVPGPVGEEVHLGCRLYVGADGRLTGVPSPDTIRDALAEQLAAGRAPGFLAELREMPAHMMRAGFVWASREERLETLTRRFPVTRRMVDRFVAGEDLDAAMKAVAGLRARGLRTTLDVLGESVGDPGAADAATVRYLDLLDRLARDGADGNVSLKLTQMGLSVDRAVAAANLARIAERAAGHGAFVRVDMEDSARTAVTLDLARAQFERTGNVGVVIQAYLRRSAADVAALARQGIRVRLCKGAYNEPASVAFPSKAEVDASFADLMRQLLLDGTYPALATHDDRLVDEAIDLVARHGIGPERYEFQMLFGVRRDLQERLVSAGQTVRVYVPWGTEWYPYFMRRLAERPANLLFLLRSMAREGRA